MCQERGPRAPGARGAAARATAGTHATLGWLGALPFETLPLETLPFDEAGHAPWPTPEGVAFARAALHSWP